MFNHDDLVRVRFIRQAQSLGFMLEEIQEILLYEDGSDSPCPRVREILEQRIEENRQRIKELKDKQERMETALTMWQSMPDRVCGAGSICHLIEATEGEPENA